MFTDVTHGDAKGGLCLTTYIFSIRWSRTHSSRCIPYQPVLHIFYTLLFHQPARHLATSSKNPSGSCVTFVDRHTRWGWSCRLTMGCAYNSRRSRLTIFFWSPVSSELAISRKQEQKRSHPCWSSLLQDVYLSPHKKPAWPSLNTHILLLISLCTRDIKPSRIPVT